MKLWEAAGASELRGCSQQRGLPESCDRQEVLQMWPGRKLGKVISTVFLDQRNQVVEILDGKFLGIFLEKIKLLASMDDLFRCWQTRDLICFTKSVLKIQTVQS